MSSRSGDADQTQETCQGKGKSAKMQSWGAAHRSYCLTKQMKILPFIFSYDTLNMLME